MDQQPASKQKDRPLCPFGLDARARALSQELHKFLSVNWLNHGELCSVGLCGYNTFKACKHT